MFNPNEFFALIDNMENVTVEAKGEDSQGRMVWVQVPDSFTADDLSSIAEFFESKARHMRGEHLA